MASKNTLNVAEGDVLMIRLLGEELGYSENKIQFLCDEALDGVIAVESLLEKAISRIGGIARSNKDGEDFIDGSDAKKATATVKDANTGTRAASISGVKNKKGLLRVAISEPLKNEVYFFKIPQEEYKNKEQLTIMFHRNGGPPDAVRRASLSSSVWSKPLKEDNTFSTRVWTKYQVATFKELCE